jgi:cystathionine beta-lyase/cystathionine gamma-synthase
VETLVTVPAMTSHAGMSPEDRDRLGLTEDLVRVSCGIESSSDLIEDFARALEGG